MPRCSRSKGFTLVELIVSISIIGVMTGLMMANFRGGEQQSEVRLASELLVAGIRSAQTASLSGQLVALCTDDLRVCESKTPPVVCVSPATCEKRVPSGYGLRFTTTTPGVYTVFYDTDDDRRYDVGEELNDVPYVSSGRARFTGSDAGVPLDIVYEPPFGKLYVNGSAAGPTTVNLTIGHMTGSMTRHVTIYRLSGKIEHD